MMEIEKDSRQWIGYECSNSHNSTLLAESPYKKDVVSLLKVFPRHLSDFADYNTTRRTIDYESELIFKGSGAGAP
jgi:hypothetical protein